MPELAPARERHQRPAVPVPRRSRWARDDGEDLVVRVIQQHAQSVLGLARSVSLCDDDANDAYQRALEIFVCNADRLDAARATNWLRTVAKNEALAIRSQRSDEVGHEEPDLDGRAADHRASTEDQVLAFDRIARSAETLRYLKPDEVRALWLRAEGFSYAQIAERCDWTYTKVNRLLSEGRARFLRRYTTIEAGEECATWAPVLSAIIDGECDADERRSAAAHLRSCGACRATLRELRATRRELRAVLPIGVVAMATHTTQGGGLLRTLEGMFVSVHERVAAGVVKAQVATEAVSAGKLAAITASAAAVAGGGAAAVQHSIGTPSADLPRPAAQVVSTVSTAASTPPSAVGLAPVTVAEPASSTAAVTTATNPVAPHEPAQERSEFDESAGTEFAADEGPASPSGGKEFAEPDPPRAAASAGTGDGAGSGEFRSAASSGTPEVASAARPRGEFAP